MRLDGLYGNEALKARLSAAFDSGRVAHSYLLCGPDGSGKHTLARSMAAAMQCTGRGELPCGVCTARRPSRGTVPCTMPPSARLMVSETRVQASRRHYRQRPGA